MKKMLVGLLIVALIGSIALTAGATFDREYVAAQATPTVDGDAEAAWDAVAWTEVDKPYDGSKTGASTLKVKLLWDANNLYVLAEVFDESRSTTYIESSMDGNDAVEVYLDQAKNGGNYEADDYQTRFLLSGDVVTGEHAGTNAKTESVVAAKELGGNKYQLEIAIPWPSPTAEVGVEMGLEFMYNDADAENTFVEALRWNADTANGDMAPWQGTSSFGKLILADETGTTASTSSTSSSTESTSSTTESTSSTTESTTSSTASTTETTESTTTTIIENDTTTTSATVADDTDNGESGPQTGVAAPLALMAAVSLAAGGAYVFKKRG